MNIAEKAWDFVAPAYRILRKNPISGYILYKEKQSFQFLLQHLSSSDINSICDLGVGRGHSLDLVSNAYRNIIAIDKSVSMIRYTRNKYSGTEFLVGDALNLPLKILSFDLIICIGLLEYFPKSEPLINQISNTLKDEGYLLITFSPKNIFTFLRVFNGHKIYSRDSNEMEIYFKNHHFKIIDMKVTLMQYQYLLKKTED
jgi:ubiquinone/menaquinone biosynthesis C-methylase UbiE